jgi:hypothetical protein
MAEAKKKLTPAERKKIEEQVAALQASLDEQEEATGAEASAEAAEEVEEQRERLASLFTKLDISEEDYDLLAGAFASGTEERTRQIVREELAAEEESGGAGGDDGSLGALEDDPSKPPIEPPPEDTPPPPSKHWSEKKIFGKKDDE